MASIYRKLGRYDASIVHYSRSSGYDGVDLRRFVVTNALPYILNKPSFDLSGLVRKYESRVNTEELFSLFFLFIRLSFNYCILYVHHVFCVQCE